MEKNTHMNPQELQIQGLIDRYLSSRTAPKVTTGSHLDEDSLAAFVDGNLNARESGTIVSHLVDCGYCRNVTAELVRLDLTFALADPAGNTAEPSEPSRISEVLSGLFSKIFGSSDGAVFAHHEPDEKEEDRGKNNPKD